MGGGGGGGETSEKAWISWFNSSEGQNKNTLKDEIFKGIYQYGHLKSTKKQKQEKKKKKMNSSII